MSDDKALTGEKPRGEVKPASPLPWRTGEDGEDAERIEDASGEWLGDVFELDRAYIVEACNSYPALRERVRQLEGCLREAYDVLGPKTVLGELLPVADAAAQPDPALSGDEWALAYRRMGWKIARALLESVSEQSKGGGDA